MSLSVYLKSVYVSLFTKFAILCHFNKFALKLDYVLSCSFRNLPFVDPMYYILALLNMLYADENRGSIIT